MPDEPVVTPMETVPPEQLLTEQEQDVYSGGGTGVGPASPSTQSVPVETMEDQGIGPRDPYPSTPVDPPVADAAKAKKDPPPPASDVFGNPTTPAPAPGPLPPGRRGPR